MSGFQISDYLLTKECDDIAAEIFGNMLKDLARDETPEDKRDDMQDRADEATDSHEWVIYNHKALMICAHCDTSNGEAYMDDVGLNWTPGESTIYTVATLIVYGEMQARIMGEIGRLIEEWEDTRPEEPEDDEAAA